MNKQAFTSLWTWMASVFSWDLLTLKSDEYRQPYLQKNRFLTIKHLTKQPSKVSLNSAEFAQFQVMP